jgi:hypothetical protein
MLAAPPDKCPADRDQRREGTGRAAGSGVRSGRNAAGKSLAGMAASGQLLTERIIVTGRLITVKIMVAQVVQRLVRALTELGLLFYLPLLPL